MTMASIARRGAANLLPALMIGICAFVVFGPLTNLFMWAFAEKWFFPARYPTEYGFDFWQRVFRPRAGAWTSLFSSVWIALATVALSMALAVPAGYALARLALPARAFIMLIFLLPQAFPSLPIFVNIARMFYGFGLNGTYLGVVLVHSLPGLVYAVWIATAAFGAVDRTMEEAARNLGAGPLRTFRDITLPQAFPGLIAASIFVFLDSIDEFTGTFFVGTPDISTLPILMFNASMGGNYQIASITALVLLVPSIGFMLVIERFLKADVLSRIGR
ncbi:MAG: ABC transporter permease subunit [Pseudotabrizicola sp.]|uniref:ABC transporter permease n=1 Tax=Pseudotabrizicola sp. TaxID=2939647 RepID=UPI00273155D5|nr:ABC transporter permease subunit [Pseudotabrizicola sp.]MDP2080377.1 ABC transporter permease subunit [Pseudotabrizicola sp.]MDZ7573779.1 ABC transporter permease subunit [Pseudotabrizicola sp.]